MGFIPARCTQCGAEITVDESKDAGICRYCGTAFVTEKVIHNHNNYVNNNFAGATIYMNGKNADNLVLLAETALAKGDADKAYRYANEALEIQPNQSKAWIAKMQATFCLGKISDLNAKEILLCGNHAIEYADEEKKGAIRRDVYTSYLRMSLEWLQDAATKISDTTQLRLTLSAGHDAKDMIASNDWNYQRLIANYAENAVLLKSQIPAQQIAQNKEWQNLTRQIVEQYQLYRKNYAARLALFGWHAQDNDAKTKALKKLQEGLPVANSATKGTTNTKNKGGGFFANLFSGFC